MILSSLTDPPPGKADAIYWLPRHLTIISSPCTPVRTGPPTYVFVSLRIKSVQFALYPGISHLRKDEHDLDTIPYTLCFSPLVLTDCAPLVGPICTLPCVNVFGQGSVLHDRQHNNMLSISNVQKRTRDVGFCLFVCFFFCPRSLQLRLSGIRTPYREGKTFSPCP